MISEGDSAETGQIDRRSTVSWSAISAVLLLVTLLSCIDKGTFEEWFFAWLDLFHIPVALQQTFWHYYKIGHSVCYAILAVVTCLCLRYRYLLSILLVFAVGVLLEVVQFFLPTRGASWVDLGYDLVGVGVGVGFVMLWRAVRGAFSCKL